MSAVPRSMGPIVRACYILVRLAIGPYSFRHSVPMALLASLPFPLLLHLPWPFPFEVTVGR